MKDISHRLNKRVIKSLRQHRLKWDRDASKESLSPEFFTLKEFPFRGLRTHPDFTEKVIEASEHLPDISHGYVMGYSVVINSKEIIFAIAISMHDLLLRLDPQTRQSVKAEGGVEVPGFSQEWISIDFWDYSLRLAGERLEQAFEYTNGLSNKESNLFDRILNLFSGTVTQDTVKSQADHSREALVSSPSKEEASPPNVSKKQTREPVSSPVVSDPLPVSDPASGHRPPNINWQAMDIAYVGQKRNINQNSSILIEGEMAELGPYGIYAVADGLGDQKLRDLAAQLTTSAIQKYHTEHPPTAADKPFEQWLKNAIMAANDSILKNRDRQPGAFQMGSNLAISLITNEEVHIANVGNCRAYHLTGEKSEQISVDHSLVEKLVQLGQITREEARIHNQRNEIYSMIGEETGLEIGLYHIALGPTERLLLISSGQNIVMTDEKLYQINKDYADPYEAIQMIAAALKKTGNQDNITAIIVQKES